MHQEDIYPKLAVVISDDFSPSHLPVFSEFFLQCIFIIFEIGRKEACTKTAQWDTHNIGSMYSILKKQLTSLEKSKKTWQHLPFWSYTHKGLSHANQIQHMALFGSWSKQTECKNIYEASGEIWTLTGYLMILR